MAPLPQSPRAPDPEHLVLEHRRLARHLAQRYLRSGDQREDLEQVAYLGLVKAAQRFDPARGVAFTTFAMPTVLGELRRFCRDTRWAVHVPRAMQERVQALRRLEDTHQAAHGSSPGAADAAEVLGWTQEEVLEARIAAGCLSAQSLNTTLRSADGSVGEAIDFLGEEDTGFADTERRDELVRALSRLSRRECRALELRGERGCSTPEIARRMGISPPQASRLVARALRRLRAALDGDPMAPAPREEPFVRLTDADPELFADARPDAVARRLTLPRGRWRGPRETEGALGLLVLNGAMLRTVSLDGKPRAELIGPGDLIRPEEPRRSSWRVVQPVGLAVLDRSLCRWPSIVDGLLRRSSDRAHALAVQFAITDLRRADDRLLQLFRALADRWGRRVPEGIEITMPMTHDMIAMLVGVHRPTVSSTLSRLQSAGRLRRPASDRWLLVDAERAARLPLAA
jgi:RNA polymerase sigma-B factor